MASALDNIWKCCILLLSFYHLATAADLRCYRSSFTDYVEVPLEHPESLVTAASPCLNVTKPTIIVAIGYRFILDGPLLTALIPTLLRLPYNILLVNWVKEAGSGLFNQALGYVLHAVPNTVTVGIQTGKALLKLVAVGLKAVFHFIGHSLGAQLGGYAARETIKGGVIMERVTGLDPARKCFEPPSLMLSVDKNCALFVDIVHSDWGGYAVNKSLGHLDFWLNPRQYNIPDGNRTQPDCPQAVTEQEKLTNGSICAHNRSWQIFNVSLVEAPTGFVGGLADSYADFASKDGVFPTTAYIGMLAPDSAENPGDYFLTTTGEYPYYKQEEGLKDSI